MIREAVGAIVIDKKGSFLLIHKSKINGINKKEDIKSEWDFVKGKIESEDENRREAILRELFEETGSKKYTIIKEYSEVIQFQFTPGIKELIGYSSQITYMFLVEYYGDEKDLNPLDDEIDSFVFCKIDEIYDKLTLNETKNFFEKNYKSIYNLKNL